MNCKDCKTWVDRGGGSMARLGWCVSEKIARSFEEFPEDGFMCQCENIRTQMDDTFIITAQDFGCIHFIAKDA